MLMLTHVCANESTRETNVCCAVNVEKCWPGATAHWIRTERFIFGAVQVPRAPIRKPL